MLSLTGLDGSVEHHLLLLRSWHELLPPSSLVVDQSVAILLLYVVFLLRPDRLKVIYRTESL